MKKLLVIILIQLLLSSCAEKKGYKVLSQRQENYHWKVVKYATESGVDSIHIYHKKSYGLYRGDSIYVSKD